MGGLLFLGMGHLHVFLIWHKYLNVKQRFNGQQRIDT